MRKIRQRALAFVSAFVLMIVSMLTTLPNNTTYAEEVNKLKVNNIARSVVASFTGGTISESEAKYKGAGQYMTVDEMKAAAETEYKIAWDKAEAEHKAAWDQAEAEKQRADSSYIPLEYVGEDYSPLDFSEVTDWSYAENVEALRNINFNTSNQYVYENGKIVKKTYVDVTLVAARLIRKVKINNIAKSIAVSFTGGTISESEAKYKGAGQYMTVDEIKAAVEIEHKIAWEKAEAVNKAAFDSAETAKHEEDPSYVPQEYVGEDYSPLDYNEDTDWYNAANVEAIKSINFNETAEYVYENGKIVKKTYVDVTLVAAELKLVNKIKVYNIASSVVASFTGGTIFSESEAKYKGAGQYMTVDEMKAAAETEYKIAWDKAEAENKAKWDENEATKHIADPLYIPQEYVGEDYSPLDFSEVTDWSYAENVEALRNIDFNKSYQYVYENGKIVKKTYVDVTLVAARLIRKVKINNIVKSIIENFSGDTIPASEAPIKGAGQYMTVDEIKAAVETAHKTLWEKAEAANKTAWDKAEAERQRADSSYIPQEYIGEEYVELDFSGITNWEALANVEAIKGINLNKISSFVYEDGKIVQKTDVDVTLVTAKLISQPTDKEITVTVDAPNGLCQGVRIDGKNVDPNTNKVTVAKDNTTRSIGICVEFGKALSKVEINGNEITEIPADNEGWLTFEGIADADSYTIKLYEGESDDITMLWVFDEETAKKYGYGEDAIVKNGKVELVSIRREGTVIYNGESDVPGVTVDEETGYVMLKKGDDVIVRLIPDYGYQLKSVSVNGQNLIPQGAVSTFELQNIQGNIHFSGAFEKSEDVVKTTSKVAKSSVISGGANAASSGNLCLSITDNTNYKTDVTSAVKAEKVEVVASLDLSLDNIVSKGDGSNWTTNITEFDKPISISMNMDLTALSNGETYGIVRDHNGVLTELEATYKDGVLTFETNQFSTYTLVKKSAASVVPKTPGNQPSVPTTGDSSNIIIWMFMMVIAFGTMVLLIKRNAKRV